MVRCGVVVVLEEEVAAEREGERAGRLQTGNVGGKEGRGKQVGRESLSGHQTGCGLVPAALF